MPTRGEKKKRQGLWSSLIRPPWVFEFRMVPNSRGAPVIAELRVSLLPDRELPEPGLTTRALRSFSTTEAESIARGWPKLLVGSKHWPSRRRPTPSEVFEELGEEYAGFDSRMLGATRTGKRGHSDLLYAQLAAEYVALVESGSKKPLAELARRHGLKHATVADRIRTARDPKRGLLTPSPRGRPGGELTRRALDLLRGV